MADIRIAKRQNIFSSIVEFVVLLLLVFLIRTFGFGLYQVPTGSAETTMLIGERFFADKLSYVFRTPRHGEYITVNNPEFVFSENPLVNLFQRYVWGPENYTKRVIGIPGDIIQGVIEGGKPVIYRNGDKLNEPYLNKYPLIHVWKRDIEDIRKQVESDLQGLYRGGVVDQQVIERYIFQRFADETRWRSYDPTVSFDQQPFYRIKEECIIRDGEGNLELLMPGMPVPSKRGSIQGDAKENFWDGSDEFHVKLGPDEYWGMGDNRLGSKDCRFFGPIKGQQIHGRIMFRIWSIDSDESWWIVDLIKHPIDFWKRIRWNRFFQRVS